MVVAIIIALTSIVGLSAVLWIKPSARSLYICFALGGPPLLFLWGMFGYARWVLACGALIGAASLVWFIHIVRSQMKVIAGEAFLGLCVVEMMNFLSILALCYMAFAAMCHPPC